MSEQSRGKMGRTGKIVLVCAVLFALYGAKMPDDIQQKLKQDSKKQAEESKAEAIKVINASSNNPPNGNVAVTDGLLPTATPSQPNSSVPPLTENLGADSSKVPTAAASKTEFDSLWEKMRGVKAPVQRILRDTHWQKMQQWAMQEARVRSELLNRFVVEYNADFRVRLRELVRELSTDDVMSFCLQRLESNDINVHREALYLLQGAKAQSSKVQDTLRQLLKNETDEQSLVFVLSMMSPTLQLTSQQIGEIGDRLLILSKHPNPLLRLNSLLTMVKFDRTATITEELVLRALTDPDSRVRTNAINMVSTANLKSEKIKQGLFNILNTAAETRENHKAAVKALGFFQLTEAEATSFNKLKQTYQY